MKPGDLPKKAPSVDGQLSVPTKEEQSQPRTGGGTTCGRRRGRGDVVPSRLSTRLAVNYPVLLCHTQPTLSDQPEE